MCDITAASVLAVRCPLPSRCRSSFSCSTSSAWYGDAPGRSPSDERGGFVETELRPRADDGRLKVAPTDPAADRVLDAHHGVAYLVNAFGRTALRAVSDVLAVDVQRTTPLAVVMTVETEVEPETEVHTGVTEGGDRHRAIAPVG